MELAKARKALKDLQIKMSAYQHASELIYYDGVTTAPRGTADNREVTLSVLTEESYKLSTSKETEDLLFYLESEKENLTFEENRQVEILIKNIKKLKKIPVDEYVDYKKLIVQSEDVWHNAKANNDFNSFAPYIEKIIEFQKKFAKYDNPNIEPYDYYLNEFEEGLTIEKCNYFFDTIKPKLVSLIEKVSNKPKIDISCIQGIFPVCDQEKLSSYLMDVLKLDKNHVGLSSTEHPFTLFLGSHKDERITTHYHEEDFTSSMYSVIHEGGHALYDTGSRDEYANTALDGGVSMAIHESQSRFYENIIGRSKEFCYYIFPKLSELFPSLKEYSAEDFYRAVNTVTPSLIRTEADEVTYCLHVMVRFEIEKSLMDGSLKVKDLPKEWNRLYKEYLGVDVPDDTHGVLQDSHWAGGLFGYFPSYALGSAYGAHFLNVMKNEVDVENCIKNGNLEPINEWNKEHIWQHGFLYKTSELVEKILPNGLDPNLYLEYLENKVKDIYNI